METVGFKRPDVSRLSGALRPVIPDHPAHGLGKEEKKKKEVIMCGTPSSACCTFLLLPNQQSSRQTNALLLCTQACFHSSTRHMCTRHRIFTMYLVRHGHTRKQNPDFCSGPRPSRHGPLLTPRFGSIGLIRSESTSDRARPPVDHSRWRNETIVRTSQKFVEETP